MGVLAHAARGQIPQERLERRRLWAPQTKAAVTRLETVRADQGYGGKDLTAEIKRRFGWDMRIAQREPGKKGWQLLPKRWVVERAFARFYRCRTLWRNAEAKREHSEANLFVCTVRLLTRRQAGQTSKWHNQLALNLV